MKTSESTDKIFSALIEAQKSMANPRKNKSGYNYEYAPLDEVLSVVNPALHANDLSLYQHQVSIEDKLGIESVLVHSSGQWVQSEFAVKLMKSDPQSVGAAITYFRRYAVLAIFGLAPEDDDAAAASNPGATQEQLVQILQIAAVKKIKDISNQLPELKSSYAKAEEFINKNK